MLLKKLSTLSLGLLLSFALSGNAEAGMDIPLRLFTLSRDSFGNWVDTYDDDTTINATISVAPDSSPPVYSSSQGEITFTLAPNLGQDSIYQLFVSSELLSNVASTATLTIIPPSTGLICTFSPSEDNQDGETILITSETIMTSKSNAHVVPSMYCSNVSRTSSATVKIANLAYSTDVSSIGPVVIGSSYVVLSGDTVTDPYGNTLVFNGSSLDSDASYCPFCGQPVNLVNGALWHSFKDFDLAGRTKATDLLFQRTYLAHPVFPIGDFGANFIHTWETKLLAVSSSATTDLIWIDPTGGTWVFKRNTDNTFQNPPGFFGSLTEASDHYTLKRPHGISMTFSRNAAIAPIGKLLSLSEPHGETVSLTYDSSGNLSQISTGLAGVISLTRNSAGLVTQVTRQRDSLSYTYSYNSNGQLISSSDFDGNVTQYSYLVDAANAGRNGLLQSFMDPLGRVTSNTYDPQGRVISQTEPGSATRTFSYAKDSAGNPLTTVKDIDQNQAVYHFNSSYLPVETDYADGSVETTTWSPQNQIASSTDALGFTTHLTYDGDGNMTSIQKPLDPSPLQITYDPNFDQIASITPLVGAPTLAQVSSSNGDILSVQRASGTTTLSETLGYDSFGHAVVFSNGRSSFSNQTDPNGLLTFVYDLRNPETRAYDGRGRVVARTYGSGRILKYTWDNHDRVTRIDDSAGPSSVFTYDVVNRVITKDVTDGATSQITQYQWDVRDRLVAKVDALGNKTTFLFDQTNANGTITVIDQPMAKTDANGNTTLFSYDNRDRLTQIEDAKKGTTQYQYNFRGDRTGVTDPLNQKTIFTFDGNGRVSSESRPSTAPSSKGGTVASTEVINYFYDLSGKLIRIEKPSLLSGKSVMSFTFDAFDRLAEKTEQRLDKNGNVTLVEDDSTYSYSPELDKVLMTQANNGVENLTFNYDPAPPFAPVAYSTQATDPKNALALIQGQYTVSYDNTNGVQSIVDAKGNEAFNSTHDAAGRLLQVASGNIMGEGVPPLAISLKYDSFGRKSSLSSSDRSSGSIQYDLNNRVSQIQWQTSGLWFLADKITEQLTYDPAGNVLAQTREFGKLSYGYDPTNQLTSVSAKGSAQGWGSGLVNAVVAADLEQDYGYDLAGNRTLASISGKSSYVDNQIVSSSKAIYQSDADGFGNLSAETLSDSSHFTRSYVYRTDGKLTQMSVAFDDQWRCDPSVAEVITQTQYFFDPLGRRVGKKTSYKSNLGNKLGPSLGLTQVFSYLIAQDKILMAKSGDGILSLYLDGQGIDEHLGKISRGSTQTFFTDHLGSVLNGAIAGALQSYDAFGRTIAGLPVFPSVLASDPVLYGFAGRQFDTESGKYYNRARMYDPSTGRFMNQDPIGLRGGLNLYRYAENNPLLFTDPSGNCNLAVVVTVAATIAVGAFFAYELWENGGLGAAINSIITDPIAPNPQQTNNTNSCGYNTANSCSIDDDGAASGTDVAIIDGNGQVVWAAPGSGYNEGQTFGDGNSGAVSSSTDIGVVGDDS